MKPVITIEGLGKRYRIGERVRYRTLREGLVNAAGAPMRLMCGAMRRNGSEPNGKANQVWALRDVSFKVNRGEVLGIIGRNGAGKSTLLKILSRITDPTEGRATLWGRVGSLLEVGTGFHPELTGRENMYLSGTIIGMRRAEIARKFDQIVDFAGIDKFVDTPVKHYSSGMYVRLAFAVAAHLETEILLVDEVLAVGDADFQKKCLLKMDAIAHEGRTVLLVSHNMAAIESLCSRAAVIGEGRLLTVTDPIRAIAEYAKSFASTNNARVDLATHSGRRFGAVAVMKEITLNSGADETAVLKMGESISFKVRFESKRRFRPCFGLTVKTDRGFRVFHLSDRFCNQLAEVEPTLSGIVTCEVSEPELMPGRYVVDLWLEDFSAQAPLDQVSDALSFEVLPSNLLGTGRLPPISEGPVFCRGTWKLLSSADPTSVRTIQKDLSA